MSNTISAILNLPEDVDQETLTNLLRPHFPFTRPNFRGQIELTYDQATNEQRLQQIANSMGITVEQAAKVAADMNKVGSGAPIVRKQFKQPDPVPKNIIINI